MPPKAKMPKINTVTLVLIFIIIALLTILAIVLSSKQDKPVVSKSQPEVVVITKKEVIEKVPEVSRDSVPVYPEKLPKYSSAQYQQVGILTSEEQDKEPIILPLFGRNIQNRYDRWQYYTASDKNTMIRLPLKFQNKDCEDDIGCNEIVNGDKLEVGIYQGKTFTATIYKKDAPRYFASKY